MTVTKAPGQLQPAGLQILFRRAIEGVLRGVAAVDAESRNAKHLCQQFHPGPKATMRSMLDEGWQSRRQQLGVDHLDHVRLPTSPVLIKGDASVAFAFSQPDSSARSLCMLV